MSVIDLDTLETVGDGRRGAGRRARSASTRPGRSPSASTSSRLPPTSTTPTPSRRSAGSSSASARARSGSSPSAARRSSSTRSPARSRVSTSTRIEVIEEIRTGSAPVGLTVHPSHDRIYVTNRGAGSVSVLGVADGAEWSQIPVGGGPGGVVVDPHDGRILVANAGSQTMSIVEDLLAGAAAGSGGRGGEPVDRQQAARVRARGLLDGRAAHEPRLGREEVHPQLLRVVVRAVQRGGALPRGRARS